MTASSRLLSMPALQPLFPPFQLLLHLSRLAQLLLLLVFLEPRLLSLHVFLRLLLPWLHLDPPFRPLTLGLLLP